MEVDKLTIASADLSSSHEAETARTGVAPGLPAEIPDVTVTYLTGEMPFIPPTYTIVSETHFKGWLRKRPVTTWRVESEYLCIGPFDSLRDAREAKTMLERNV